MFALGTFAAIYHPVGMAMLIEASGARGRTLAFNGVCGNLGVSLAAGISAALAYWISWRAAFIAPAFVCLAVGIFYVWMTPGDTHQRRQAQVGAGGDAVAAADGGAVRAVPRHRADGRADLPHPDDRAAEDRRRAAWARACRCCWSAASPPRC